MDFWPTSDYDLQNFPIDLKIPFYFIKEAFDSSITQIIGLGYEPDFLLIKLLEVARGSRYLKILMCIRYKFLVLYQEIELIAWHYYLLLLAFGLLIIIIFIIVKTFIV